MPLDGSAVLACAETWRPSKKWASTLKAPYEALTAGATGLDAVAAWCEVIMMMGDTRGAPLALIACLHAATLIPPNVEDRRLDAHRQLCLLDLGLASAPGPIAFKTLGDPATVSERPGDLEAWTIRALAPFDGDLARAAWYALRLAACRTDIVDVEPVP